MHYWRGVITHTSFLLAQPIYLGVRYLLGNDSFASRPNLTWTLHVLAWLYIATRISYPFFTSPLRRLPSPPGERFLLCHLNLNGGKPLTSLVENWINDTPNDGIVVLWAPFYLFHEVIVTQPDAIMDVLNSRNYDWEKPAMTRNVLTAILGEGLVSVEGNVHKTMRRVAAPAFSGRQTRDLAPLFYAKGLALVEVLARQVREADDGVVEVMGAVSRVTLDIIGKAGIGMDFNSLDNEESTLAKLYEMVMEAPSFFLLVDSLFPRWLLQQFGWKGFAKTIEAQSRLRSEVRTLLQEKKVDMNQENSTQHGTDIIASIMKSGDFSDDYLIGQLLTFLAAGHDTTASALVWATWLLSLHPQVQDRLRAECSAKLPDSPASDVDAALFNPENMPFLSAVCNETLRLYPPAPSTVREAVVPTTICGVPIAKGTLVTIPPWAVNRSRALWGADAAEFIPERWLEGPNAGTGGAESPYAFLTFLHGPRSCIGQGFARLEMKCLLALLITRFSFEPAYPDQKVEIGGFITIKPQGGLRLKVQDLKSQRKC